MKRDEPMSGTVGDPEEIKARFWKELDAKPNVFLSVTGSNQHSAPMRCVLDKDVHGHFWFYTSRDNRAAGGGAAMVHFTAKGHDLFACVAGTLVEEKDTAIIDKYWSNPVASYYEKGKDDPNMLMLRFDLDDAEIWVPDATLVGTFKLLTGIKMKPGDGGDHAVVDLG